MSSHRCGGTCCRSFTLPHSPAVLAEKLTEILAFRDGGGVLDPWMIEWIPIAEMVIAHPAEEDGVHRYTCRHHDAVSGLCTIYQTRPPMCRDYPSYGKGAACGYCGFAEPAEPELVQLKAASS